MMNVWNELLLKYASYISHTTRQNIYVSLYVKYRRHILMKDHSKHSVLYPYCTTGMSTRDFRNLKIKHLTLLFVDCTGDQMFIVMPVNVADLMLISFHCANKTTIVHFKQRRTVVLCMRQFKFCLSSCQIPKLQNRTKRPVDNSAVSSENAVSADIKIVDTSIQHPISGQSTTVVKAVQYIQLIWQILPLVMEEH